MEVALGKTWQETWGLDAELWDGPSPSDTFRRPADRYEPLGALGEGGGGVVERALDRHLGRALALKRPPESADPEALRRFIAEAQATAQLQHPGVVTVHDLDVDARGRPFFTLAEVKGRTLEAVIDAVHVASGPLGWGRTPDGWSLSRLLDALVRVAETVAFAHARGVTHRDLKPANVMVGAFGEVLVLDWGLAGVSGEGGVETDRTRAGERTIMGQLSGTPAYMAPEQARGQRDRIGPLTDVYGLGAVLYQILTGRPPYRGASVEAVLIEVLAGPPVPPGYAGGDEEIDATLHELPPPGPPVPEALGRLCAQAMAREPRARTGGAAAFAEALRAWIEGAGRLERALVYLEAATRLDEAADLADREALALKVKARQAASGLAPWASEAQHAPVWSLEDAAQGAAKRAQDVHRDARTQRLAASAEAGAEPEILDALATNAGHALRRAEEVRDWDAARAAELRLRRHAEALPRSHPARAAHLALLRGEGTVTLITEPEGAEVVLERLTVRRRRLEPQEPVLLGRTPLIERRLEMGSYQLRLRAEGHHEAIYPLFVTRLARWNGSPTGAGDPAPVPLLPLGALGPDEVYVPPGPFLVGGDPEQSPDPPRWGWRDGFVIGRYAISFGDYLEFLNERVAAGALSTAEQHQPRYGTGAPVEPGSAVFQRGPGGTFLVEHRPEHALAPGEVNAGLDWPILQVDHASALAYAGWRAARDGLPWRLPEHDEWEKAARGVDGRTYPMGEHLDPSWTWIRDSLAGQFKLRGVRDLPIDTSVYGVMGMAGNMRCWTADPTGSRGGAWAADRRSSRCSFRVSEPPGIRHSMVGIRLVRSIPARGGDRG